MYIDIKNYIESKIPELNGRLYPVYTTDTEGLSIVYKVSPSSGGHMKQSQLQLIIIGPDYDICKQIESSIIDLLDMEEDNPFVLAGNTCFWSSVAGGGEIFNDGCQMHEITRYFIVDWRKRNGSE